MDCDKIKYLLPKLNNRFGVEKNRVWKYVDVKHASMRGYKPFEDAVAFKSRLQTMFGVYDDVVLSGITNEVKTEILNSADQTLRHEFDLLGSGPMKLDPVDWQVDFKCGKHWPKMFYRELTTPQGADIKVPWELSRCQHLLWLGEAFLLTKDDKYAKEVIGEIEWWIDDNPLMYTVNWKCAMDVAFRAVNWMFALNMIARYKGIDDAFTEKVSRSLWQHGFFIRNNLERVIPYSNNHYTSDLVGLLYIGELFAKSNKGRSWLKFGLREFYKEIRLQVLPSGAHFERSLSYHRLMTEMLSYPIYMLCRIGESVPSDITIRIKKMYSYIANYTKPNGLAPLIADNDDGRFVPFMRRDFRHHNYLNDSRSVESLFVSVGIEPVVCPYSNEGNFFEDARVAIVKDCGDYLFFNSGGYSRYPKETDFTIGTHTHNDLLSFELALGGKDIIVDAGTYLYTSSSEDRNAFRSTMKHNTIVVDGEEQNGFGATFSLKRNVKIGLFQKIGDKIFSGEYTTLKGRMTHHRQIKLDQGCCEITDTLKKSGNGHEAKFYFHFAEGIEPFIVNDKLKIGDAISFSFSLSPLKIELKDDTLSPSFGLLVNSKTAVISFNFENEISIKTIIQRNGQE